MNKGDLMDKSELLKNKLCPMVDIISENLDVLFVGYNPGILSAKTGHHYAGKSNRFWKLLYESGLTLSNLEPEEDQRLLELRFGSTNIVHRPTKSASEITSTEFEEGSKILEDLIKKIMPKIVCFVGIGVYRTFAAHMLGVPKSRLTVTTGKQKNSLIEGCLDFVCSNPSGLNTIPYNEQLKCFKQLKQLLSNII